jgi:Tfp pilus assembly protein PilO
MTARDRTVLMVVAMLVIVGAFWFLLIGPRHKAYSAAADSASTAQSRKDAAAESVAKAEAAKKTYPADYAQIAQLGKAVPVDDEVPSLVYQLSSAADANKIDFRSIRLSSSAGAAAPAPAPAAAATTTTATTTDTTSSSTTSTTPTPPAAAPQASSVTAATLPPGAAIGTAGFPTMPFDFNFDGSFFDMSDFLQDLDRFVESSDSSLAVRGRLLAIDGIGITASRKGFPQVKASISATAFLLPTDEGLTAGATAQAPSSASTTAPGSSTPAPPSAATGAK